MATPEQAERGEERSSGAVRATTFDGDVLPVSHSRDETRALYDRLAGVYDLLAERSEQPLREKALQLLAAAPGETVLEIGPGTGRSLVQLARSVQAAGRVVGLDLSLRMLSRCQARVRANALDGRVHLLCADATQLPLVEGGVDGVFMSFVLELFDAPDMVAVLSECRRVLRPGGRLAVVSLTKEPGPCWRVRAYEWIHRHFPKLVDCRPIYVRRAVEAAGLEVVHSELDSMWVPVEIVLARRPRTA